MECGQRRGRQPTTWIFAAKAWATRKRAVKMERTYAIGQAVLQRNPSRSQQLTPAVATTDYDFAIVLRHRNRDPETEFISAAAASLTFHAHTWASMPAPRDHVQGAILHPRGIARGQRGRGTSATAARWSKFNQMETRQSWLLTATPRSNTASRSRATTLFVSSA